MIEDRQPILVAFYIGPGNGAGLFFQPGAHKDSGGSGVFILGATGMATLSSGGTQLILSRWTGNNRLYQIINTSKFIS